MSRIAKNTRERLAASGLFGFAATGRRTAARRGGKEPPLMEGSLLDEGAILADLNQVETAAIEVEPEAGEDRAET